MFYYVTGASWSSNNSLEFWNKGNTVTTVNSNAVRKTIYSPSINCYAEPSPAAFTGFTTSGNLECTGNINISGSWHNGYDFYCQPNKVGTTIFFPALGCRIYNTTGNTYINSTFLHGGYLAAGPADASTTGRNLALGPGWVQPVHFDIRAIAFVLRPTSE